MSVCSCAFDCDDEIVGDCVMRNRVARSIPIRGNICKNCEQPVEIGQRCIDHSGCRWDSGWFNRFHEECFTLMETFAEKMCGGEWGYPFDIDEAAEHAFANAHDPYWMKWLEIYERTWEWTPEPGDPVPPKSRLRLVEVPTTRGDCRAFEEIEEWITQ